jgi:hypothetical protein
MPTIINGNGLNSEHWSKGAKPPWSFPMIEELVNSLAPLGDVWADLPHIEAVTHLRLREQLLGVATLSCRACELLHEIITDLGIYNMIERHSPSVSAAAKQTVLDCGLSGPRQLVNKSVTVRLGTLHLLGSGAGDFRMNRTLIYEIANQLCLTRRDIKACRINPADYSPEYELGLLEGMVSPFFSPAPSGRRLAAVILLEAAELALEKEQMVAILVSPFESLVLPLVDFSTVARLYAQRAYPDIFWTEIDCD